MSYVRGAKEVIEGAEEDIGVQHSAEHGSQDIKVAIEGVSDRDMEGKHV